MPSSLSSRPKHLNPNQRLQLIIPDDHSFRVSNQRNRLDNLGRYVLGDLKLRLLVFDEWGRIGLYVSYTYG